MTVTSTWTATAHAVRGMGRIFAFAAVALAAAGSAKAQETASLAVPPAQASGLTTEPAAGLPAILSEGDVVLYRRVFAAQRLGDWAMADKLASALTDRRLMGYVQAERYLAKGYRTSWPELEAWLVAYPDLPQAERIRSLAANRRPDGAKLPRIKSVTPFRGNGDEDATLANKPYRPNLQGEAGHAWRTASAAINSALRAGKVDQARHIAEGLSSVEAADPAAADQLRAAVALRLFLRGDDAGTLAMARGTIRSAKFVPDGAWIAGLASWRSGRKSDAAPYFEAVAVSGYASLWTRSAGAYWAARSHLVGKRFEKFVDWMEHAAEQPYSFYGLLANRALGREISMEWQMPKLEAPEIARLKATPGVARALALIQLDRRDLAETELRIALPQVPEELAPALLTVAERGGMPRLSMSLGARLEESTGKRYDSALYPIPPWVPQEGYTVNRALVYAIIRQESQFDPKSTSSVGASGLMQLMPETAKDLGAPRDAALDDPALNLKFGQKLVDFLLSHDNVKGNLFRMAVAYNGGVGKLQRWHEQAKFGGDPLMYIETVPSLETRQFIGRMLANFWIYQVRLNQKTEALDLLASGRWPIYDSTTQLAETSANNQAQPALNGRN